MTDRGVSLAEAVRRLRQILGKYMQDIGIAAWGTTARKAQDQYRVLYVDDDGKLVIASIAAPVDVSDRWARELGKVDIERVLGNVISPSNPLFTLAQSWGLNRSEVVNGDFEDKFLGWLTVGNPSIVTSPVKFGQKALKLNPNDEVWQCFVPPIPVDQILPDGIYDALGYWLRVETATADYVNFHVVYTDGATLDAYDNLGVADTWGKKYPSPLTAGKLIQWIAFKGRNTNVKPIYIDGFYCRHHRQVDVTDRATRVLGTVSANVTSAPPLSISNIPAIINGSFEEDFTGWQVIGNVLISATQYKYGVQSAQFSGLAQQIIQSFSPAIDTNGILTFSLWIRSSSTLNIMTVYCYYSDGTSNFTNVSATVAGVWQVKQIGVTADKYLVTIYIVDSMHVSGYMNVDGVAMSHLPYLTALRFGMKRGLYSDDDIPASDYVDVIELYGRGVIENLAITAEHEDIIVWTMWDGVDFWTFEHDPSFANLHAFGGECGLYKETQWGAGASRCTKVLLRPIRFKNSFYLMIENPTVGAVTCRSEGVYQMI